jgi:hypothetical protein
VNAVARRNIPARNGTPGRRARSVVTSLGCHTLSYDGIEAPTGTVVRSEAEGFVTNFVSGDWDIRG